MRRGGVPLPLRRLLRRSEGPAGPAAGLLCPRPAGPHPAPPHERRRGGGGGGGAGSSPRGGFPWAAAAVPLLKEDEYGISEPEAPPSARFLAPAEQDLPPPELECFDDLSIRSVLLAEWLDWLLWGTAVVCSIAGATLGLRFPAKVGHVLDLIQRIERSPGGGGGEALSWALGAVVGMVRMVLLQGAINALYYAMLNIASDRVVRRLRTRILAAILRQDVHYFDTRNKGELAASVQDDVAEVRQAVKHTVSMGMRQVTNFVGGLAALWLTNPHLTQLMALVIPTFVGIGSLYVRVLRAASRRAKRAAAKAEGVAHEVLGNLRTVRSFASEDRELARYAGAQNDVVELGRSHSVLLATFIAMNQLSGSAVVVVGLAAGSWLVGKGEMTGGQLSSFMMTAMGLQRSLAQLSVLSGEVHRASESLTRIRRLVTQSPQIPLRGGSRLPDGLPAHVTFRDVRFRYPSRPGADVLCGVSLDLRPGTVSALVGATGSGKSTVAALLQRFYDPNDGAVAFGGVALPELCPRWLRQQIGIVNQEPALFAGSIASNIAYGRPGASEQEVRDAARAANCDEFISRLPDGYGTEVGEGGVQLSGGQKQRVAIARAMLRDPRVLILDEATSALDAESEALVQGALERLMRDRTVLVIAHRLSTVQRADRIYVMKAGEVAEEGPHDELMTRQGLYHSLVRRQMMDPVE
eukprot:TRINITY_DN11289_c0_g1_i4.p1 TRINITY_DN11289_c0_g1~~TRINITY_DN11289_c0_g1_i4.p1  ORF type:complete len:694 (+),score=156.60 TRINITY_DN11289_c0_g1_i4:90-2171(+)